MNSLGLLILLQVATPEVIVEDREPVALVVTRNAEFGAADSVSSLLASVIEAVEARAWVRLTFAEGGLAQCTQAYDDALFCQIAFVAKTYPEANTLLFVAGQQDGERSLLRISALELDEARRSIAQTEREVAEGRAPLDAQRDALANIFSAGATHPPVILGPKMTVRAAVEEALTSTLEPPLRRPLMLGRAGLDLNSRVPVRVEFGEPLSQTLAVGPEGVRIRGIAPGRYPLRAVSSGFLPIETEIDVAQAGLTQLQLALREDHRAGWQATTYAGLGLLGVAGGLAVYGLLDPSPAADQGQGFRRLGDGPRAPGTGSSGGGPVLVGLSAGLAVAGAGMSIWGLSADEPDHPPWLEILVSIAAGAAVYGVFEGVDALR